MPRLKPIHFGQIAHLGQLHVDLVVRNASREDAEILPLNLPLLVHLPQHLAHQVVLRAPLDDAAGLQASDAGPCGVPGMTALSGACTGYPRTRLKVEHAAVEWAADGPLALGRLLDVAVHQWVLEGGALGGTRKRLRLPDAAAMECGAAFACRCVVPQQRQRPPSPASPDDEDDATLHGHCLPTHGRLGIELTHTASWDPSPQVSALPPLLHVLCGLELLRAPKQRSIRGFGWLETERQ